MKALVTGGAGFIGSNLTERLLTDGYEVTVLDILKRGNKLSKDVLKNTELVIGDVRDFELVKKCSENCTYIFHLAAVLGVDIVADNPIETMETETIAMKNICDSAMINGCEKIIYTSTSGVYGKSAITEAVNEDIHISPKSSYAIAKRFNEIYLSSYHLEKGLQSISLRLFNVYGKHQDNRMVIPRFLEQALANKEITVFGNGQQTRDFTHIDDVLDAIMLLTEKSTGAEIYNVSNEREYSIGEVAEVIKKLTGSKSKIVNINFPDKRYDFEVERRWGSSQKLFNLTGFKPHTDIETGLRKTYDL